MRGLFIKAFELNEKYVSYNLAKTGPIKFQEIEAYYDIIKNEGARRGAEKLLRVYYLLPGEKRKEISEILNAVYKQNP